jgi:hypothetical protein
MDKELTDKQLNLLRFIMKHKGEDCYASTYEEKIQYINDNKDCLSEPSKAQLDLIVKIENRCPYAFEGSTKDEAIAYISEYKQYLGRMER